ncbi:MAG TPA: DUF4386 domain-containing protein [Acidimicrobiia bacterium]|nr:DUF4386 domain-containing protein [Acidimicrobiia bacterium]
MVSGGMEGSLDDPRRTARVTGLWYLALAITGMLGFLVVRPQVWVVDDPSATFANLIADGGLARLGLVLEFGIVVSQAAVAVWFYRLFRGVNQPAAFALGVFGMANAAAIMASAVFLATAIAVAEGPAGSLGGDPVATIGLLTELSSNAWGVGALFFGLWLIPMGYIAATSGLMPTWLGRILVVGGVGYTLSAFVSYGMADAPAWLIEGITIPATIGEVWMVGYLLIFGVRRSDEVAPAMVPAVAR